MHRFNEPELVTRDLSAANFPLSGLASGMTTKAANPTVMTMLIQKTQRRNVKYEATADPKSDSISLILASHGTKNVTRLNNSRLAI